jgi:hypothetical protein
MLQGFFLSQKKKRIFLFRGHFVSCQPSQHFTILFRPTFVTNECFC